MPPAVSVVMPVRNGMPFLDRSIASIATQTFRDFEFLILNNGSTDTSRETLTRWADRDGRIKIFNRPEALGMAGSSNAVAEIASAPLIARMDADDVSYPTRLQRQVQLLAKDPNLVLVGTLHDGIDSRGRRVMPRDRGRLRIKRVASPFCHGSIMFRRDAFIRVGGYRPEAEGWEDLELYMRLAQEGSVAIIPDALYRYRFHRYNSLNTLEVNELLGYCAVRDRCVAERQKGRDYTSVFQHLEVAPDDRTIARMRWVVSGRYVWAGIRPPLLEKVEATTKSPGAKAVKAKAWLLSTAGRLNPRATRSALATYIRARDLVAGLMVAGKEKVAWDFGPS